MLTVLVNSATWLLKLLLRVLKLEGRVLGSTFRTKCLFDRRLNTVVPVVISIGRRRDRPAALAVS